MKTVPKLRVVAHDDASQVDLPDLPEEVRFALGDVAPFRPGRGCSR
jgi:hypothetical protein